MSDIKQDKPMPITFDVPYFFDAEYVPRGKRKPQAAMFGGSMQVEIENLTSDEAPIAVTVTRDDSFSSVTRDFVAFDGAFYDAHKGSFWRGQTEVTRLEDFTAAHLDHHAERALGRYNAGEVPELPPEEGAFYSIGGNRNPDHWNDIIENAKDQVRQAAAKVIFVDGVLHYRCKLPTILASITYRFGTPDTISVDIGAASENTGGHGSIFAIDEHTSAIAWAQDRHSREHESRIDDYLTVEVHHPQLLPSSSIREAESVRFGVFLLAQDVDLKTKPDGYLMDFMRARRATIDARINPTEAAVSEMLDAWENLYRNDAEVEDARCRSFGSGYVLDDDTHFKALMGVQAAWNNRTVVEDSVEIGVAPRAMR